MKNSKSNPLAIKKALQTEELKKIVGGKEAFGIKIDLDKMTPFYHS